MLKLDARYQYYSVQAWRLIDRSYFVQIAINTSPLKGLNIFGPYHLHNQARASTAPMRATAAPFPASNVMSTRSTAALCAVSPRWTRPRPRPPPSHPDGWQTAPHTTPPWVIRSSLGVPTWTIPWHYLDTTDILLVVIYVLRGQALMSLTHISKKNTPTT